MSPRLSFWWSLDAVFDDIEDWLDAGNDDMLGEIRDGVGAGIDDIFGEIGDGVDASLATFRMFKNASKFAFLARDGS